jgi:hypothetical protein
VTVEKTEQELIDDYRRVEAFLADPAVKGALRDLNAEIFEDFKRANAPEQKDAAWAISKALDLLSDKLIRTMAQGQMALKQKEQREAREQAQKARAKR